MLGSLKCPLPCAMAYALFVLQLVFPSMLPQAGQCPLVSDKHIYCSLLSFAHYQLYNVFSIAVAAKGNQTYITEFTAKEKKSHSALYM